MEYEIPIFAIGLVFGAGLLFCGLGIGIWLGRRTNGPRGRTFAHDSHWLQLLEAWSQGTDGVANVVSGCRDALDRLEDQCRQAHRADGETPQDPTYALLSQIIQTNEQVRRRLENAEGALQKQAHDISSYVSEARTDALTGLPNRRAMDSELSRALTECGRHQGTVSLIMLDIDHFKRFNDRFGHLAGDAVLASVGRVLRQNVQPPDLAARLGGEEFAVILPGRDAAAAGRIAEQLRAAVERNLCNFEHRQLRVTVSCGAAEAQAGDVALALLKRADQALYASKGAGRNCCHLHDGQQCVPLTRRDNGELATAPRDEAPGASLLNRQEFQQVCQDVRSRLLSVVKGEPKGNARG